MKFNVDIEIGKSEFGKDLSFIEDLSNIFHDPKEWKCRKSYLNDLYESISPISSELIDKIVFEKGFDYHIGLSENLIMFQYESIEGNLNDKNSFIQYVADIINNIVYYYKEKLNSELNRIVVCTTYEIDILNKPLLYKKITEEKSNYNFECISNNIGLSKNNCHYTFIMKPQYNPIVNPDIYNIYISKESSNVNQLSAIKDFVLSTRKEFKEIEKIFL